MNTILLFVAIPILVIVVSIILEKLLNNPLLIATLVFAVFLVITFAIGDTTLLIAAFAYALLALLTALAVRAFCCLRGLLCGESNENNNNNLCDTLAESIDNNNNNSCSNNNNCGCNRHRGR